MEQVEHCPCGSGKVYAECCELFISNQQVAQTPEQLMRSRYTAYSIANIDHIERTMKAPANLNFDKKEAEEWAREVQWLGLNVIRSWTKENQGLVEFIAFYLENDNKLSIHETSQFARMDGEWYYTSGLTADAQKVGRNDLCICGSLKKYKKCCGTC